LTIEIFFHILSVERVKYGKVIITYNNTKTIFEVEMDEIKYQLKERASKVAIPDNPGFGQYFTDHVFEMDYKPGIGWHNAVIKPVEYLSMHPATMFFHYGQSAFEGLKAFKTVKGEIVIFRPDKHFTRLNNSSRRLCMPEIDTDFAIKALKELVKIEQGWISEKDGESLYIRPFIIGTESALGVRPSREYKFMILLSPVGAYYPEGFKPVKIMVSDQYVRAVRNGLGECKTPANYASSLLATEIAKDQGYTQVLWLDAVEMKNIEEVGTMNIYIRFKDEIVTPKLTGGILHGVTRATVLEILKEWGMNPQERVVSIDEFVEKYDKGEVVSVFGTGTAAVISTVGLLRYKDRVMEINGGKSDDLSLKLFDTITSIHRGRIPDTHNWLVYVK